jgi:hypothetical protein
MARPREQLWQAWLRGDVRIAGRRGYGAATEDISPAEANNLHFIVNSATMEVQLGHDDERPGLAPLPVIHGLVIYVEDLVRAFPPLGVPAPDPAPPHAALMLPAPASPSPKAVQASPEPADPLEAANAPQAPVRRMKSLTDPQKKMLITFAKDTWGKLNVVPGRDVTKPALEAKLGRVIRRTDYRAVMNKALPERRPGRPKKRAD